MSRIKRGGYVFMTWKNDHAPEHVHVYEDRRLIVKWNLENDCAILGYASRRIQRLIAELEAEGSL